MIYNAGVFLYHEKVTFFKGFSHFPVSGHFLYLRDFVVSIHFLDNYHVMIIGVVRIIIIMRGL